MTHRVEASQRRTDKREWVMDRSERTRHLIELGGLVQKAGLIELADADRAVLLGAFLAIAAKLQGEDREQAITLWRRRGKRAFADDPALRSTSVRG
jgi:Conjugal transfer protein TraD